MKISNSDLLKKFPGLSEFPDVVVDQTNYRISEIIRRNRAGEQVLGNNQLNFDFTNENDKFDPEKLNPFNDMGFDLDDVIKLANEKGQEVTQLQNRLGEIKAEMDKAKSEEQQNVQVQTPVQSTASQSVDKSE